MILHCKNAEMTIILSFLHFYIIVISAFLQCKIIQFCQFFLKVWQFFTSEKIKKVKNKILFFLNAKIWVGGSVNQEIKKNCLSDTRFSDAVKCI